MDNVLNIIIMNEPKQKREGKQSKRPEFIDITVKPNNENLLIEFDLSIRFITLKKIEIFKKLLIETLISPEFRQFFIGTWEVINAISGTYSRTNFRE